MKLRTRHGYMKKWKEAIGYIIVNTKQLKHGIFIGLRTMADWAFHPSGAVKLIANISQQWCLFVEQ